MCHGPRQTDKALVKRCAWPGLWDGRGEHRAGGSPPGEVVSGHRKSAQVEAEVRVGRGWEPTPHPGVGSYGACQPWLPSVWEGRNLVALLFTSDDG